MDLLIAWSKKMDRKIDLFPYRPGLGATDAQFGWYLSVKANSFRVVWNCWKATCSASSTDSASHWRWGVYGPCPSFPLGGRPMLMMMLIGLYGSGNEAFLFFPVLHCLMVAITHLIWLNKPNGNYTISIWPHAFWIYKVTIPRAFILIYPIPINLATLSSAGIYLPY